MLCLIGTMDIERTGKTVPQAGGRNKENEKAKRKKAWDKILSDNRAGANGEGSSVKLIPKRKSKKESVF